MVLGCDAVQDIATWHRWQELLDWAHIVIIARPGWQLPRAGELAQWLKTHQLESSELLRQRPCGGIVIEELRPLGDIFYRDTGFAGLRSFSPLPDAAVGIGLYSTHKLYC